MTLPAEMTTDQLRETMQRTIYRINDLETAIATGHFPNHTVSSSADITPAEQYDPIKVTPIRCIDSRCPNKRYYGKGAAILSNADKKFLHDRVVALENKKPWWRFW